MTELEKLQSRHSVRVYDADKPFDNGLKDKLKAAATMINTHTYGLKFIPVFDDPTPFTSFRQSYGMFRGASNYFVCIIDTGTPDVRERAGYHGEELVMRCVELGLGTCFVGVTYGQSAVNVQLRAGEKIAYIITVGFAAAGKKPSIAGRLVLGLTHKKAPEASYFFDAKKSGMSFEQACELYPWLREGLEGIACAPSAVCRRPVRVWIDGEKQIRAYIPNEKGYNPEDFGIAKYNFTQACGSPGEWEWGNNGKYEV